MHVAGAWSGMMHVVVQSPQCATSLVRSWQLDPQQSCAPAQGCVAEQPGIQAEAAQIAPGGQSTSRRQPTQVCVAGSQIIPPQAAPSSQPGAHALAGTLQY